MRFALYPNVKRDPGFAWTDQLIESIASRGGTAYIPAELAEEYHHPKLKRGVPPEADFVISLGGDGTFLSSLSLTGMELVPRVGVNLGSVGFLQEILPADLDQRIDDLYKGNYRIQLRAMFQADCYDPVDNCYAKAEALNDVILTRGVSSSILKIRLSINGAIVETVPGDGLIVATPTGSTAYSLSCGGPIVHPGLDMMVITPICPHSLHNRSYITDSSSVVRLELIEGATPATLSIDGRIEIQIQEGGYVDVSRSRNSLKYVQFGDDKFYETLPIKIQQRGISQ